MTPTPRPDRAHPEAAHPEAAPPEAARLDATRPLSARLSTRATWPLLVALLLAAITLVGIGDVNVTWDEALGDFFFGQRNLSFLTSFDARYLDFATDPYPSGTKPDLSGSAFRNRPWEHPPAAATAAAAVSFVTSNVLGLLDPFDGFHAVNALFAALLAFVLWRFLEARFGLLVAVAAVALLFTMPRVFAHQLANIKDFPLMVLFSTALLVFLAGYERGSSKWMIAAGAVWGLALATRPNALFLPLIPLGVMLIARCPEAWKHRRWNLAFTTLVAGFTGCAAAFLAWPHLWADPIARYLQHIRFLTERSESTRAESLAPAFDALLASTPPLVIAFFLIGLWPLTKMLFDRDRTGWLLLLWLLNVPVRYLLPGSINYDGVRHFLEIFPPIAIVAAMGLALPIQQVVAYLEDQRKSQARLIQAAPAVLCTLLLLPGVIATAASHPFQIAYWNTFAGGPYGAWRSQRPQAGDYWGLSYRQGLEWLNQNAPPNSAIAVPVIEHAVQMVAPERLRSDLGVLALTTPFSPQLRPQWQDVLNEVGKESDIYVMMVPRRDWTNELMAHCLRRLEPVAEWKLGGAPVLLIYKWPAAS